MDDTRYPKRARQACEPCRRKKSKCPGERPVCSYCERLGQSCFYNAGDAPDVHQSRHSRKMEYRMDNLEGKMDQLIQQLTPVVAASRQSASYNQAPTPGSNGINDEFWLSNDLPRAGSNSRTADPELGMMSVPNDALLSPTELQQVGRLYLKWCHKQPLILFDEGSFVSSLNTRDKELLLALQAVSLRFPPGTLITQKQESIRAMAKTSRRLVMDRITDGQVELSTLQTLVLLSIADFSDGKTAQAGLSLSMASHLAQSLQPGSTLGNQQECDYCVRAISIIHNLQGCIFEPLRTIPSVSTSGMITSTSGRNNILVADSNEPEFSGPMDPGIVRFTANLSEVWHMARAYAANRVGPDAPPPWSAESDYSRVTLQHLEVDSRVPLKYRFSANKLEEYDLEALEQRRDYWGPYLFIQLVYAAIPCLLNHPFLLSMRLRNFRHTMPQSFIHQSFDLITRHAGWIVYFIDLLDKKGFQASDPTLAHAVAIVATIHLQHSFVEDRLLRNKAKEGFDKCLRFLDSMGSIWLSASNMAENLRKLQKSVIGVGSPNTSLASNQQTFSIDAQLLWDILIYERAGRTGAVADQSMFSSSASGNNMQATRAEFDLVGSAGISGHKSAPKETPAYAPNDAVTSPRILGSTPKQRGGAEMTNASGENRYLESVGGLGAQENWFLQPDDFGRAIESWLNFDPAQQYDMN